MGMLQGLISNPEKESQDQRTAAAAQIVVLFVSGFNDFQNGELTLLHGARSGGDGGDGGGRGGRGGRGGANCGWLFRRRMADHRVENVQ